MVLRLVLTSMYLLLCIKVAPCPTVFDEADPVEVERLERLAGQKSTVRNKDLPGPERLLGCRNLPELSFGPEGFYQENGSAPVDQEVRLCACTGCTISTCQMNRVFVNVSGAGKLWTLHNVAQGYADAKRLCENFIEESRGYPPGVLNANHFDKIDVWQKVTALSKKVFPTDPEDVSPSDHDSLCDTLASPAGYHLARQEGFFWYFVEHSPTIEELAAHPDYQHMSVMGLKKIFVPRHAGYAREMRGHSSWLQPGLDETIANALRDLDAVLVAIDARAGVLRTLQSVPAGVMPATASSAAGGAHAAAADDAEEIEASVAEQP